MSSALLLAGALSFSDIQPKSVCGIDDRITADSPAVGIVSASADGHQSFCTITLIGDRCALTAGHCLHHLEDAHFFTDLNHLPASSGNEFTYKIDSNWTRALQSGIGNDWAVVRLKPNSKTGLLPGKVHGFIETAENQASLENSELFLDAVQRGSDRQFSTYEAHGQTLWTANSILYHDLDTVQGSSGALIIEAKSGKAVAINTHGGCDTMKNNKATIIGAVPFLIRAIRECLAN